MLERNRYVGGLRLHHNANFTPLESTSPVCQDASYRILERRNGLRGVRIFDNAPKMRCIEGILFADSLEEILAEGYRIIDWKPMENRTYKLSCQRNLLSGMEFRDIQVPEKVGLLLDNGHTPDAA